jgi:hypothetical protein
LNFCKKSEERWAKKRSQGKGGWKLQGCHDGFVEHDGFKSALLTGRGQGLMKINAHKTKRHVNAPAGQYREKKQRVGALN